MILALALVVSIALACVVAQASPLDQNDEWVRYKLKYGKVYTPEEDALRFELFLASKEEIRKHNEHILKHNEKESTYKLGLNHFSDMSDEMFAGVGGMLQSETTQIPTHTFRYHHLYNISEPLEVADSPVPEGFDWREVPNRVSSVKDQGNCNSGWAFAAAGTLEGQVVVRTERKELQSLSAQNLLDCTPYGASCKGGHVWQAFAGVTSNGGINSDRDYPYIAKTEECQFRKNRAIISDHGYGAINVEEDKLAELIKEFGPVAVELRTDGWKNYQSGVFNDPNCSDKGTTRHAVLVVGYGTDPKLGDYWILKNSWSEDWGEKGYMRLRRGARRCKIGIETVLPTYPNL